MKTQGQRLVYDAIDEEGIESRTQVENESGLGGGTVHLLWQKGRRKGWI